MTPKQPPDEAEAWAVEETHTLRPYAVTGGRTEPTHSLHLDTQLVARPGVTAAAGMVPEADAALALCRDGFRSVAEISAYLGLPAQITKILLSDLIDAELLDDLATLPPETHFLEQVLVALRRKWPDAAGASAA
ncbi:DUF742 domain-containing protein [Streptomyces nanshensis]|uniref:DUF742 domain-containing protein n=1 Tax=Streptomyces nanshensis TaxID=518642 RepID=A0A1E7LA39_9ACTN|nr:DUF742 domain-containing protein [Streptomyces nanshensis]OEV13010.1 hypothetical protein AN218_05740 [Streptomyces nanshensis]